MKSFNTILSWIDGSTCACVIGGSGALSQVANEPRQNPDVRIHRGLCQKIAEAWESSIIPLCDIPLGKIRERFTHTVCLTVKIRQQRGTVHFAHMFGAHEGGLYLKYVGLRVMTTFPAEHPEYCFLELHDVKEGLISPTPRRREYMPVRDGDKREGRIAMCEGQICYPGRCFLLGVW